MIEIQSLELKVIFKGSNLAGGHLNKKDLLYVLTLIVFRFGHMAMLGLFKISNRPNYHAGYRKCKKKNIYKNGDGKNNA